MSDDFKSKKERVVYMISVNLTIIFFFLFGLVVGYVNATHDCIHNNNQIVSFDNGGV